MQEKEPVFHIPLFLLLNSYLDLKQEISDHIAARTAKSDTIKRGRNICFDKYSSIQE